MATQRDVDPRLLSRVRQGELTRGNTTAGSPERHAVDRVAYLRRRARHPELTARQALAHPAPSDVLPSISLMVDYPPRLVVIEGLTRRDVRRAARYDSLVRQLDRGRIAGATFRRRIAEWRPIAGFVFLADPDAVLALLDELRAHDVELFIYDSGRAS